MTASELGRLTRAAQPRVWPHDARDFTPPLLENAYTLSALSLDSEFRPGPPTVWV